MSSSVATPKRSGFPLFNIRISLLLVLVLSVSCRKEPDVQNYTVPKSQPVAESPLKPTRVEAGPIVGGANGWFFKLMGPTDSVLKEAIPFTRVVQSLRFADDGTPSYQVPEGWVASNGPPPRYQTLKIANSEPPMEMTVSTLPVSGGDHVKYLQSNINRWREQLGLAPNPSDKWLEEMQTAGEVIVIPSKSRLVAMVNLNGETDASGPTRMLAAIVIDRAGALPSADEPKITSPVDFVTPEGWQKTAGNSMRLASLESKADDGTLDVSVTRLGGGGDVLANVNRWRGQVSAEPTTQAALDTDAQKMEISGQPGVYVEALGPEQGILAAIVEEGPAKWFFKAQGPIAAINREREHFKQFLSSVKLQSLPK